MNEGISNQVKSRGRGTNVMYGASTEIWVKYGEETE